MKAPLRLMPEWSKDSWARIQAIERDFHVRVFGEELARVNLNMSDRERQRYVAWMRRTARQQREARARR